MKKNYIKYYAALLLFGFNGIVADQISLPSMEIVFWRTLLGSILLAFLFIAGKEKFTFQKKKTELIALAVSGIAMGTSWMFLYEAYRQIGVGVASLCYYCGPIIVMILSPVLFHEKLTKEKTIGFIIVLLGIFLVNGQPCGTDWNIWGVFCGMVSAVMYAFMVIFNKKAEHITGLENSLLQLVFSFLTAACFTMIRHGLTIPSGNNLSAILVLGIVNTGIGCYFYFSSINKLPIQTVAVCGYLEPLSAVILAAVCLREIMSIPQIIGSVFIIGGAVFCELFQSSCTP